MAELHELTATELLAGYKKGEIRPRHVFYALKKRIEKVEPQVKAWVHLDFDGVEERLLKYEHGHNTESKSLYGVPVAVKDVYNTAEFRTEMGSVIWEGFTPGNDARVVHDLKYDGAYTLGKTCTSEFAVHALTETRNPYDLNRVPGTSSSGSVAAVAAGMAPVALGTQTGGSVIRPASYCGVFGYKPTYGLVPRTGVLKTTDTLDTMGWFARSVDDLRLLFESVRVKGRDYPYVNEQVVNKSMPSKVRIGVFKGPRWQFATTDAKEAFDKVLDQLAKQNTVELVEIDFPDHDQIMESHQLIYCKSLSYYFKAEVRNSKKEITDVLNKMLDDGDKITPASYQKEIDRQAELTIKLNNELQVDTFLTLSAGGHAPEVGKDDIPDSCWPWTYLGMPALNIPLLKSSADLPIGVQLVGAKYRDYEVFNVADLIWTLCDGKIDIAEPV